MSRLLIYLWVAVIASGPAYFIFGQRLSILLMFLIVLTGKKIIINKKLIISIILFGVFMAWKCSNLNQFVISKDFHSLYGVMSECVEISFFFLAVSMIQKNIFFDQTVIKNGKRIFCFCFYPTLLLTIVELMVKGRNLYRTHMEDVDIWCAPQYFLYFAIMMAMICFSNILNRKNEMKNWFCLGVNVVFVYLMNYTTQTLFMVFSLFLVWILNKARKTKKKMIFYLFVFVVFMVGCALLPDMIVFMNNNLLQNNLELHMRLTEIATFLKNGDLSGQAFGGRIAYAGISWKTFLNYPITGVPFSEYNLNGLNVGGHYEWADSFARFGVVGMVLYVYLLKVGFEAVVRPALKRRRTVVESAMVIVFLIYGFFNPFISYAFIEAVMIALHFVLTCSSKEGEKIGNKNRNYVSGCYL